MDYTSAIIIMQPSSSQLCRVRMGLYSYAVVLVLGYLLGIGFAQQGLELKAMAPKALAKHGKRCTPEQVEAIAEQDPIKNSNCPDKSSWIDALVTSSRHRHNAVLVWIGCNRGDDLAEAVRVWSRNATYDTTRMKPYMPEMGGERSCPLGSSGPIESFPVRPVSGFCVEAMKSTSQVLSRMYRELGWDSAVKVIHAAVSSYPGITNFPRISAGAESWGLGSSSEETDPVQVITVDNLSAENDLQSIDILSIDTEGNDMRVIFGAVHTLSRVRYLEFEYHNVNRWGHSDLQDLVDLLDQFNFDCYWTGNKGQLWRLTGCWHDSYYTNRFWSNIACVNRKEHHLYMTMSNLAQYQMK